MYELPHPRTSITFALCCSRSFLYLNLIFDVLNRSKQELRIYSIRLLLLSKPKGTQPGRPYRKARRYGATLAAPPIARRPALLAADCRPISDWSTSDCRRRCWARTPRVGYFYHLPMLAQKKSCRRRWWRVASRSARLLLLAPVFAQCEQDPGCVRKNRRLRFLRARLSHHQPAREKLPPEAAGLPAAYFVE